MPTGLLNLIDYRLNLEEIGRSWQLSAQTFFYFLWHAAFKYSSRWHDEALDFKNRRMRWFI